MLKGIHPANGPDLLKTLAEMGHGDEIVLNDAHFPGHTVNALVLRADGLALTPLLDRPPAALCARYLCPALHHDGGRPR